MSGRYVAGDALRGYTVCFSVYDGHRGVAFEARAGLHADCLAARDWASLEALSGTRAPQWALLAQGTEDYSAAADHLETILLLAAQAQCHGAALEEALAQAAARSDHDCQRRELADWGEFRASEREVPL